VIGHNLQKDSCTTGTTQSSWS